MRLILPRSAVEWPPGADETGPTKEDMMDKEMQEIVDGFRAIMVDPIDIVMALIDLFVARGLIEVAEIEGWASEIEAYLGRVAA